MKLTRWISLMLCFAVAFSVFTSATAFATSSYHIATPEEPKEKLPETVSPEIQPGSVVVFGTFEQDNDFENGAENLQWSVLDRDGDRVLLITSQIIEIGPYADLGQYTNWNNSILRKWLNNDFYQTALTMEMQSSLVDKESSTYSGKVEDKVFVLTPIDARKYFERKNHSLDPRYHATTTAYALSRAKQIAVEKMNTSGAFDNKFVRWWLFSNSQSKILANLSGYKGNAYFTTDEATITYEIGGYRPSVWVDLVKAGDMISMTFD